MSEFLTGRILIASPSMEDKRFFHSIILVCDHDDEHALGIVLNKSVPDFTLNKLLGDLGFEAKDNTPNAPVLEGGPCQPERGFILHSMDWDKNGAVKINDFVAMSVSKEILGEINSGNRPNNLIVALGYSGWGPGQLEGEIIANSWLVGDADNEIIFSTDDFETKWEKSLKQLGIDPRRLSINTGNA